MSVAFCLPRSLSCRSVVPTAPRAKLTRVPKNSPKTSNTFIAFISSTYLRGPFTKAGVSCHIPSGAQHLPPFLRSYPELSKSYQRPRVSSKRKSIIAALLEASLCSVGGDADDLLQVPEFKMCVDFRGVQVAVAQQLLHLPETGAATQQMRRARVTKGVCGGLHS